jgi:methylmalonyl-CoA/ethylmalonyl-CoA epimerase
MMKFDHIGVAAGTLERGREVLRETLEIVEWSAEFADPVNHIYCQFGRDASGVCYELVAPLDDQSPIGKAVRTRANVLHHVAYLCADLDAEAARLEQAGCVVVTQPAPAIAFGGARIQFFFNGGLGFILELIEAPGHAHAYLRSAA